MELQGSYFHLSPWEGGGENPPEKQVQTNEGQEGVWE